jgi:hypothetical protein
MGAPTVGKRGTRGVSMLERDGGLVVVVTVAGEHVVVIDVSEACAERLSGQITRILARRVAGRPAR